MLAFLDSMIRKNEMVESTASALRTGCRKVLEVDDGWAEVDLRSLDVDALVGRFRIKHRADLRERSLYNYEMRFRQTVDMYLKWLDNDPTWRPSTRTSKATNAGVRNQEPLRSRPAAKPPVPLETASPEPAAEPASSAGDSVAMIAYPLPIRPGVQGRLLLPEDLSRREAERVANFVNALAFDERLAITARPADDNR
jgi:hypothetical protein